MLTGVQSALDDSTAVATFEVSPPLDDIDEEPVDDEPVLDDDEQAAKPAVRKAAANAASNRGERGIQGLSFW
jgi:hypothetical protein